ncbi:hypothetical protein MAPG_11298 [Magnaporthiopsis poae ATCC 64411]|uniref:Uncharacterized protein n=1 Tax=Magnaporthiopsis poae (strain ATCC 64411 / 73-15) TaxID=644358 RepID=A0A0C4EEW6_MAGP6|nr:hypothetical protein MAPG_11298 [Magnaporthiopsis poae ATCC 64411]
MYFVENRQPHEAAVPMLRMLFDAVMSGPNRDANFPNTKGVREQFCEAARRNNLYTAQFLLDRGADVDGPGPSGESPSLVACEWLGDAAFLKLLLERGADSNYRYPRQCRCRRFPKLWHSVSGNNARELALLFWLQPPPTIVLLLFLPKGGPALDRKAAPKAARGRRGGQVPPAVRRGHGGSKRRGRDLAAHPRP